VRYLAKVVARLEGLTISAPLRQNGLAVSKPKSRRATSAGANSKIGHRYFIRSPTDNESP
jgi:hypothetical protein